MNLLPLPELPVWRLREVERIRASLASETYTVNGALHWKSNNAPVPLDVFRDGFAEAPAGQKAAVSAHTSAALAAYRAQDPEMSSEAKAEARSVHGAGAVVVNVLTGRRTRL